jgi:hypothetical protein
MSRQERCQEYAKAKGPHGASRDQKNLDHWAARAEQNSEVAPRASRKMDLSSTGKRTALRDTGAAPFRSRSIDARMVAKDDMNIADDERQLNAAPAGVLRST